MNHLSTPQVYLALFMLGVVLFLSFYLLAWLSCVARKAWLWVDDAKTDAPYPVTLLIAQLLGYKHSGGAQFYKGCRTKDSCDLLGMVALMFLAGPLAIYLAFQFYPVVLSLALLYAIAHTARFARRHKKLFDKHIKDPEAHK